MDAPSGGNGGSTSDVLGDLPTGWKWRIDEQGRPFYYNRSQHKTSWERPGGGAPGVQSMTPTGAAATRLLGGPGQAQVQAQAQQAPEEIDHKEEINTFWEKCCVFVGMGCTLIAAGVFLFVLLLLIMFPDQRDKNTTAGMQACFFGLLAILFVVLVRMLLVPRYTGDNGAFRSMLFRPMRHEWQWRPAGPDTCCFMDAGGKFSKVGKRHRDKLNNAVSLGKTTERLYYNIADEDGLHHPELQAGSEEDNPRIALSAYEVDLTHGNERMFRMFKVFKKQKDRDGRETSEELWVRDQRSGQEDGNLVRVDAVQLSKTDRSKDVARAQDEYLSDETKWVWSVKLRGCYWLLLLPWWCKTAVAKFMQLLVLCYEPAAMEMPDTVLKIGHITLLDFNEIFTEPGDNRTIVQKLQGGVGQVNSSLLSEASVVLEQKAVQDILFDWETQFYCVLGIAGAVAVLVCMVYKCGCIVPSEDKVDEIRAKDGSRKKDKVTTGRLFDHDGCASYICVGGLAAFIELFFIPVYHHLVQAFACTSYNIVDGTADVQTYSALETDLVADDSYHSQAGLTDVANSTRTGYRWKGSDVLLESDKEWECYEGRHLNILLMSMAGLCVFLAPVGCFLFVRPPASTHPNRDFLVENPNTGVAFFTRRPRESPWEVCLEATIVTLTVFFDAGSKEEDLSTGVLRYSEKWRDITFYKLSLLAAANFLLAMYYCNPLVFMCGNCCSPYSKKVERRRTVDGRIEDIERAARTGITQCGYPFNWEPLNFIKACSQMVLAAFAAAQAVAVYGFKTVCAEAARKTVCEKDECKTVCDKDDRKEIFAVANVADYWFYAIYGAIGFYSIWLAIRLMYACCRPLTPMQTKRLKELQENKKDYDVARATEKQIIKLSQAKQAARP